MRHARLSRPAFLLGFALSGFFDGIVLHQILQWHHLLSALGGDLRFQVAADGWFHAMNYGIAAAGLWLLWRARRGLARDGAGRRLAGWGLIGFAAWHVIDAVLSHWILGIHRIRMDVPNPLLWDLGWLALFGLLPLLAGLRLRRGGGRRGRATAATLAALAVASGVLALRAPPGPRLTTVAFAPAVTPAAALGAVAATGGRLVWSQGGVVVVAGADRRAAWGLYGRGALFVGGAGLPPGCVGWSDAGSDAGAA